jgi:hypothetical protein
MKIGVWVATVTALSAVTVGICALLKSPRWIQKANQSWLPLSFSSAVVSLKRPWALLYHIRHRHSFPQTDAALAFF